MEEIVLRYYQKDCVDAAFEGLLAKRGQHPVLALPTAAGKSYIIAELIRQANEKWGVKALVISHVKEIIEQDYKSIKRFIPDVAVYSAGLGSRQIGSVTVAGIQSIYRDPELFKDFNLIIIDEAHRIAPRDTTMYRKFFDGIGEHIRIGLTATPFRLGTGYIYEGDNRIFDYLAYDLTSKENFNQLVKEGYLCRLITKGTDTKLDVEGVRTTAGDFNDKDLSARNDKEIITNAALKEIIEAAEDRKKWLIFAIDIEHAEHIAEGLMRNGVKTNIVHSKMEMNRDKVIEDYKNGKYRCIVNVNVLTTGFDDPDIDLIALLRPTKSPVLHVQTVGRGLRISPAKHDCLILDFAGNIARLGPINDVVVYKAKKGKKRDEAVMKECPTCHSYVYPAVRLCPDCGYEFLFEVNIEDKYSELEVVSQGAKWFEVDEVFYHLNKSRFGPDSMKVTYRCGVKSIREWICVEHSGFAKLKADNWIKFRGGNPVDDAEVAVSQAVFLNKPSRILVDNRGKYAQINDSIF